MNTLAGKGVSVVAPAGGAFSMYTNWEQDGSKQWETFLSSELPDWLAANKGLAPADMPPSVPHKADTARWRWPSSTRTASATPDRCQVSCTPRRPPPTAPSPPAWPSSAGRQLRHVGCAATGPVEMARPVRARVASGGQQQPDMGLRAGRRGGQ
ncbi:esterase family protein [Mycobacterium xenopi 4042]|uniref:Esterase family protein n=1 Tax=Mycobacterium xenopi 4042 TaxID=1299334 RepID=X8DIE0_MYCXE|nr:esterase family protein [Mycobacterium xenopi 4042]